jgi:hypothetical protein
MPFATMPKIPMQSVLSAEYLFESSIEHGLSPVPPDYAVALAFGALGNDDAPARTGRFSPAHPGVVSMSNRLMAVIIAAMALFMYGAIILKMA